MIVNSTERARTSTKRFRTGWVVCVVGASSSLRFCVLCVSAVQIQYSKSNRRDAEKDKNGQSSGTPYLTDPLN